MRSHIFHNLYSYLRGKDFNPYNVVLDSDGDLVSFTLDGFGKSGNATVSLLIVDESSIKFKVSTRYDQHDQFSVYTEYEAFKAISLVAWGWYLNYHDRGYGVPEVWKQHWLDQGLIKKVIREEYVIA